MPTRTQTPKGPGGGRFARPTGKPAQRSGKARRPAPSGRPSIVTRRKPRKSGVANAIGKVSSMLPGTGRQKQRRAAAGGRGKKGPAGLALLAGAAGLMLKNRNKLTSMMRGSGSSNEAVDRVEPRPLPGTPGPSVTSVPQPPLRSDEHPST
jgi:hypothetical protein